MLRLLTSLLAEAGAALVGDKGALVRVDQLIQEASRLHAEARRALALALAESDRETKRIAEIAARAEDIEARAVAALEAGREDLAASAAETIARLETERRVAEDAGALYAAEVAKLRAAVDAQRRRLASLDQGRRLARVGAALGGAAPRGRADAEGFAAAEEALAALRARQADAAAVAAYLAPPEERLVEDMAAAGFGAPPRVEAASVMARLREKARPVTLALAQS